MRYARGSQNQDLHGRLLAMLPGVSSLQPNDDQICCEQTNCVARATVPGSDVAPPTRRSGLRQRKGACARGRGDEGTRGREGERAGGREGERARGREATAALPRPRVRSPWLPCQCLNPRQLLPLTHLRTRRKASPHRLGPCTRAHADPPPWTCRCPVHILAEAQYHCRAQ